MISAEKILPPKRFVLPKSAQLIIGAVVLLIILPLLLRNVAWLETFPESWNFHLREPIDAFQQWLIPNRSRHPAFTYFFNPLSDAVDWFMIGIENMLLWLPWPVVIVVIGAIALRTTGLRMALFSIAGMFLIGLFGLWDAGMQTLVLTGVSILISVLLGIPLGIWAARSERVEGIIRPILDTMQTMPAFVYLIPIVLFFGVARVPGVIATVIYALPPMVRLTSSGIRQVDPAAVEAALMFGSTPRQLLTKVQIPLAVKAIVAGLNQTIMMAFSMVVIAALVGSGGLGQKVLVALQRLKVGEGFEAGIAIVILAIILDRISQGSTERAATHTSQFRLLPDSWHRYSWATNFENRLNAQLERGANLSKRIAKRIPKRGRLLTFMADHPYLVGSLCLTLLVLLISLPFFNDFPASWRLEFRKPVDSLVIWMRDNLYQIGNTPFGTGLLSDFVVIYALKPLRGFMETWLPWPVLIVAIGAGIAATTNRRLAIGAMLGFVAIGFLSMWTENIITLAQVIVAVVLTLLLAIPLGIWSSRSDRVASGIRPILDLLQTIPAFVFLIPVIILFNVGEVPGIIASVLYALPPGVRLVNLGLRSVSPASVEAAKMFGSTPRQTLTKVQLPLALPTIIIGVNQVIMMVLAMVIVASLVGGGGLGLETLRGIARNEPGRGLEAGIAIVILAMILDRYSQALAAKSTRKR